MLSPLVVGPMMARTWLSSTSCFAKETAFSAFPWESLMISSIFLPSMPPVALASSTSICRVRASGRPRVAAGPVTAKIAPIRTVSAANAGTTRMAPSARTSVRKFSCAWPAPSALGWMDNYASNANNTGIVKETAASAPRVPVDYSAFSPSALIVAIPFFSSTCSARSRSSICR